MIDRSLFINFFRSIIRGYLIFDIYIYEGFEGIYYKSFVSFEINLLPSYLIIIIHSKLIIIPSSFILLFKEVAWSVDEILLLSYYY